MNFKSLNMTLGIFASLTLVACAGSNNGGSTESSPSTVQQASSATPAKSSSIPKSSQSAPTSGGNVIMNSGGTQNIASNGGDCAPVTVNGGTQITVISGQTITNVSKKSSSSAAVECESIETGEKITLDGQKVCMSAEACIGQLSSYEAVRAVESACRDAVVLSDSEVASLLVK